MTVPDDIPDAVLTAAAAKGDQPAFAALMRRHKAWLYRFIRRYVGDRDDAYDVLQDSFVSAWSALARFDPARPFPAWLRQIALNKCRDRARRNAVRNTALALFGFAAGLEQTTPPADEIAASGEALKRLEAAIARLPRRLKEPLILTVMEGLSHREAGALLGINAKAVEMRVYRARRQLAGEIERDDIAAVAAPA